MKMNTPNEEQETMDNSAYNPFPEPQTIPSGWDLSGLPTPQAASVIDEEDVTEN
jgi:uncharacterized protein YbdZ (MbtH family)